MKGEPGSPASSPRPLRRFSDFDCTDPAKSDRLLALLEKFFHVILTAGRGQRSAHQQGPPAHRGLGAF
jgi:hypothetical protein